MGDNGAIMRPLLRMPGPPGLLVALPLAAIGALALYALESDYALLRSRQIDAALGALRGIDGAARSSVERVAGEAVRRISGDDRPETLRSLVLGGAVGFVVLHRAGRQVFPPENAAGQLVVERDRLAALAGVLSSARAGLVPGGGAWAWVAGPDGSALLHCARDAEAADVCVLLNAAGLRAALAEALAAARPGVEPWSLALADPDGRFVGSPPAGPPLAAVALAEPLRGWRAEARLAPDATVGSPPVLTLAAVLLPLLTSWLLLARQARRAQRAAFAETRHRAGIAAQLSHELRTPLANLRLYAGLIRRRVPDAAPDAAPDAEAVRGYCTVIEMETDRLGRLVDNAVAFARDDAPQAGGPGAAVAPAVPDAVVRDTVDRLRPLCDEAGCPVAVRAAAPHPVRFDSASVAQILTNLLDNARKYAPGCAIEVATRIERADGAACLVLEVRDHGPGVPRGGHARIFDPAVRAGGAAASGFGLGLAVVRRLARSGGGDVRVEDAHPGARFVAWVRVRPADGGEEPACAS